MKHDKKEEKSPNAQLFQDLGFNEADKLETPKRHTRTTTKSMSQINFLTEFGGEICMVHPFFKVKNGKNSDIFSPY